MFIPCFVTGAIVILGGLDRHAPHHRVVQEFPVTMAEFAGTGSKFCIYSFFDCAMQ